MITEETRQFFKKNLGKKYNYTQEVLKNLRKNNVTNRNGNEHSPAMVRMVFNGERENLDIEAAILEVLDSKIATAQRRNELLKKIKGKSKSSL